ncbi:hypothetical protein KCU77_g2396, partial [Aureobasidium melanogenum]
MPSPRNSKFMENFDDDESDSSSSDLLASAPSPELPPDSVCSEPLAKQFSAMVLGPRTSRAVHHLQLPAGMQPQAPTQAQAPVVVQGSGTNTVAADMSSERAGDGIDEHQNINLEAVVKKGKTSALSTEQGTSQHEQHDAAQEPSAKTANTFLHQLFDEVLREQKITPEEMHHASKYIEANFKKLEQDLESFDGQRLRISQELQKWFVIHKHDSDWETKTYCQTCLLLFEEIDEIYFVAFSNVRDMMEVIEKGLKASVLLYKSNDERVSDRTQNETLGEFCAPLLQSLESTERMLQALEDDAEKRKGWPHMSSSDEPSSMTSQPRDNQDQKTQSQSDQTKAEAAANSSAIAFSQINEVFGNEVLPFAHFEHMIGRKDGQVSFAMNSFGDISAQQWSQPDSQWFYIGHFSTRLRRTVGTLASHHLKDELQRHVRALPRNSPGYFKAVAKQHEARTMKIEFGPEELQACLPNVSFDRTRQEVANTPSVVESSTQSKFGPGDTEMADEDQDGRIDGVKSKQAKVKKSKSKKQKKKKKKKKGGRR